MSSIPDSWNYSMSDVAGVLNLNWNGAKLSDLFDASWSGGFDTRYALLGVDALSEFRNYQTASPTEFNVTPKFLKFDLSGGIQTVTLESTGTWTSSVGNSWVSRTPSSGNAGIITININCQRFMVIEGVRSTSITFNSLGQTKTVNIQQGLPVIT